MKVRIDKSFQKDVERIRDRKVLEQIAQIIDQVSTSDAPQDIANLKKLKVGAKHYRIRTGDYRIGLILDKGTFEFVRILPRKDLYKYFP